MFTLQHLQDLERQCTRIALLSANLRMSVYNSPEWHNTERTLEAEHEKLAQMFKEAKQLIVSRGVQGD